MKKYWNQDDPVTTVADATVIQRYLADIFTQTFNEDAADADEDGEVSVIDATLIQRHLADIHTYSNIGQPKS